MIKVAGSLLVDRRWSGGRHTLFKRPHTERLPRRARSAPGAPCRWNRRLVLAICHLGSSRPGELQPVFGANTRYRLAELTRWQCRCNFLRCESRYFYARLNH